MERTLLCKSTAGRLNGLRFVSGPCVLLQSWLGVRMIGRRTHTRVVIYVKGEGQFSRISSSLPTDRSTDPRQVNPFIVMK